jgi:hypothetical protein
MQYTEDRSVVMAGFQSGARKLLHYSSLVLHLLNDIVLIEWAFGMGVNFYLCILKHFTTLESE